MDKSFLNNIKTNQLVAATKQFKTAVADKVLEALAIKKAEISKSMGISENAMCGYKKKMKSEDLDSEGPKSVEKDKESEEDLEESAVVHHVNAWGPSGRLMRSTEYATHKEAQTAAGAHRKQFPKHEVQHRDSSQSEGEYHSHTTPD